MINLLPPGIKQERKYGRLNKFLTKQLIGLSVIGLLAVGFMLSGVILVNNDEKQINEAIAQKTEEYEELKIYEQQAQALNGEVRTIGQLFDRELQFSSLLVNIAQSIPLDARLTSLSLQGSVDEPLTITAVVSSQESAGVLRKSLVDSENFVSADILNITNGDQDESGNIIDYNVTINATLSEEAKSDQAAAQTEQEAAEPTPTENGGPPETNDVGETDEEESAEQIEAQG